MLAISTNVQNEIHYCRDVLLPVNQSDASYTTSRHEQCLAPGCSQTDVATE
jgi:hypothetical protein